MSGATYRIEIKHDPHSSLQPWDARIYRVSDDMPVGMVSGATTDAAISAARAWVAAETERIEHGVTVLVGDDGQDADAPHSVKVPEWQQHFAPSVPRD